jgi:hypothetical protein
MTYTVKYKKVGSWVSKTLRNVKGDGFVEHGNSRFFVLSDESRVEVPTAGMEFCFSKDRFIAIRKAMEVQTGHPISTNSGVS